MGKRRHQHAVAHKEALGHPSAQPRSARSNEPRIWMLVAAVALLVARPLVASEGTSWLGDDLPFDMLWFILSGLYFAYGLLKRELALRFGLVDSLVLLLVGLSMVSCLASQTAGPRLSLNMLWSWAAVAAMYLLFRQLIDTPQRARLVITAMLALAVVLSCYGIYQVFIGYPNDRDAYRANPDQMLREAGHWYPAGSPERALFESRLNSDEPIATFALTNSLAGYLAPWLIVAVAIAVAGHAQRQGWLAPAKLMQIAMILPIAACLFLTHSRSAYVAVLAGIAVLALRLSGINARRKTQIVVGALLTLVLVGIVFFVARRSTTLDEARRSLGYRFEYWQATLGMIFDHPVLGVGPGHFQDYYTRYKLPEASEEVRDPHNFLLELAATSGIAAGGLIVAILVVFAWRITRASPVANDEAEPTSDPPGTKRILGGAAGGVGLAYLIGPAVGLGITFELLVAALAIGTVAVLALYPWVRTGRVIAWIPGLAVLVLVVHLLASGGMSFPGVANTFWLALALGLNLSEQSAAATPATAKKQLVFTGGLLASMAAIALCYWTAYVPVLRSYSAMTEALYAAEQGDYAAQLAALRTAAALDPASPEPWEHLSESHLRRFLQTNYQSALREFRQAQAEYVKRRPQSSSAWRQSGRWFQQVHQATKKTSDSAQAVASYRRAVELYPTSGILRAELAVVLASGPQRALAAEEAREALRLDVLTPHADKKLPDDLRRTMRRLAAPR